jgi:uncharacterized protein
MNIWFDATLLAIQTQANSFSKDLHTNSLNDTCQPDNCPTDGNVGNDFLEALEDPGQAQVNLPELSGEDVYHLSAHTFVLTEVLHTQRMDDSHWLVCNPVGAGSIMVVDNDVYALLLCFQAPRRLKDVVEECACSLERAASVVSLLVSPGFLLDLDLGQPVTPASSELPGTLSTWLHVTNACNLRCSYCYISKSSEHMADDTMQRSVDAVLRSAISYHYKRIQLTYAGGEAMLRLPQVMTTHDYALQRCQEHGIELSANILSNGVALPLRAIEQLKERKIRMMISLDGVGEDHDQQRPLVNGGDSFRFVDRTITRLLAHQFVPYINVTVTQRNLATLPRLLEYILQRDLPFGLSYYRENDCSSSITDLQFTDADMIAGMRRAFAYLEEHLPRRSLLQSLVDKAPMGTPHNYHCGVGRSYLAIDQRGGIAKCQVDIKRTLTTIDAVNPLRVIRESQQSVRAVPIDEKEGCRSCEWRYWCTGGCPMLTYRQTGRSDIKSPNCNIYKALFPDALRLEALRLLRYGAPVSL